MADALTRFTGSAAVDLLRAAWFRLSAVLSAREIPQTETALIAAFAAREAIALAHSNPTARQLRDLLEALHAVA